MPKETYGIGIFLAEIAAGLLLAAYAGPYRLVADLQIALFSTNIVVISFFVTMLLIGERAILSSAARSRRTERPGSPGHRAPERVRTACSIPTTTRASALISMFAGTSVGRW